MLTYVSQRCILEHFEANKRLHFAARCSSIRGIERSIPLRLHTLSLTSSSITLNEIIYEIIQGSYLNTILGWLNKFEVGITHQKGSMTFVRDLSKDANRIRATGKLFNDLLGRRCKIFVGNLSIGYFVCPDIQTMKIQANNVKFVKRFDKNVWKWINVSSFPLKSLDIHSEDAIALYPRIRFARKMILR